MLPQVQRQMSVAGAKAVTAEFIGAFMDAAPRLEVAVDMVYTPLWVGGVRDAFGRVWRAVTVTSNNTALPTSRGRMRECFMMKDSRMIET